MHMSRSQSLSHRQHTINLMEQWDPMEQLHLEKRQSAQPHPMDLQWNQHLEGWQCAQHHPMDLQWVQCANHWVQQLQECKWRVVLHHKQLPNNPKEVLCLECSLVLVEDQPCNHLNNNNNKQLPHNNQAEVACLLECLELKLREPQSKKFLLLRVQWILMLMWSTPWKVEKVIWC